MYNVFNIYFLPVLL